MKKVLLLMVSLLWTLSVFADVTSESNSGSASQSTGVGVGSQGQSLSVDNHGRSVVQAADLSNGVGSAVAPALSTTLTETCMGSTSIGAGFSGGSFSFGTTWRDSACVRRLDAREIRSFGDVEAAKEVMCDSDLVRAAFKRVGRPCANDGGIYLTKSQLSTSKLK
ncbi:MAG: hypothetical protein ACXW2E_01935 [Nitrososphaeraceae archaeon]